MNPSCFKMATVNFSLGLAQRTGSQLINPVEIKLFVQTDTVQPSATGKIFTVLNLFSLNSTCKGQIYHFSSAHVLFGLFVLTSIGFVISPTSRSCSAFLSSSLTSVVSPGPTCSFVRFWRSEREFTSVASVNQLFTPC